MEKFKSSNYVVEAKMLAVLPLTAKIIYKDVPLAGVTNFWDSKAPALKLN